MRPSSTGVLIDRLHGSAGSSHSFGHLGDSQAHPMKGADDGQLVTKAFASDPQIFFSDDSQPSFASSLPRRVQAPSQSATRELAHQRVKSVPDPLGGKHPHAPHTASRADSPEVQPLPFADGRPPGISSIEAPPPPPLSSSPEHPASARRAREALNRRQKRQRGHERGREPVSKSGSVRSGSSAFLGRKERRPRSRSLTSNGSSSESLDPVIVRNARVFPPRLPAATTRIRQPPKNTAIHNITSWIQNYEREGTQQAPQNSLSTTPPLPRVSFGDVPSLNESESTASSWSAVSFATEVERLWQILNDTRAQAASLRSNMLQQRRELRAFRRKRDDAYNDMMSVFRPMLVNPQSIMTLSPNVLHERLQELQNLWNEYNQREASYESQELVLDEVEENLILRETRFFSVLAAGHAEPEIESITAEQDTTYPSDVPLELRGISPEGPQEGLHPRYLELTSAVGDLQNAKEQHAELRAEREALEESIAVKKSTGQQVSVATYDVLEQCRVEEESLGQRVGILQMQAESLKQRCEKEGIMRKHMSVVMQYFLDPNFEHEEEINLEEGPALSNPLRHRWFPELLTQPEHVMAEPLPLTTLQALRRAENLSLDDSEVEETLRLARKELSIERLLCGRQRQSKSEFVNRWLLQILRQSSLEVVCLYETFLSHSRLVIQNTTLWQYDVLHYWFRDGTFVPVAEELESGTKSVGDFFPATPLSVRTESATRVSGSSFSRATDASSAKMLGGGFHSYKLTALANQGEGSGQSTKTTNKGWTNQYGKIDIDRIEKLQGEKKGSTELGNRTSVGHSRRYHIPEEVDESQLDAELEALWL